MTVTLNAPTQLDPCLRLLILLARLQLTEAQRLAALALCEEIEDWEQFTHRAQERFVLPLVYRHLRKLTPPSLPEAQLDLMKLHSLSVLQYNMNVTAALRDLVKDLLQPLELQHVFFKGPTLAERYYDEPAMRFCQDIDVLVPRERMAELLEHALSQGYSPLDPAALESDATSLAFVSRVQKVITLVSPRRIAIEFHQRIDNIGSIYDSRQVLAMAEPMRLGSRYISVMPTAELFVYICWHHTKHYWSHLHWLVDMDAIQRHPSFDLKAVMACADRRNLRATVEASLELFNTLADPELWEGKALSDNGREMLAMSLKAMQGDHQVELAMRRQKATPDFSFSWQTNARQWLRWKLLGWTRLFRPSYADYQSWPLPQGWQWLYRVTRPFRESYVRITSGSTHK
ncbi:nucleotidyltransferase family protein [Franzmannia qiaohouensis]|uniref:Nucleotidyltransferase family protein n=1 Tax=Franzmannia qiaohouensis TaxID=1329370 RepID=A0ABU1HH95_9GAMM|nr:nucleotidyltransferase family protein [Halomonas qiaohouensis]MDR5906858.1 nucleotidyltransferase family protein [Halomonas qiaohouensis]